MIKIKVGTDPKADVERVRRVREALGGIIQLSVDANGGWTVADSIWAIRRMEPYDLVMAEQPVHRQDVEGMAQVRRSVGVPIMADETVFTEREALEVIRREAADMISVYPGKNGGILRARAIAKMAEAAGVPCHVGSNLEWDVGASAMAHLAVSTQNIVSERYPADILGPLYHVDHVVTSPLRIEDGYAEVPSNPGLGVELDEEKIREGTR